MPIGRIRLWVKLPPKVSITTTAFLIPADALHCAIRLRRTISGCALHRSQRCNRNLNSLVSCSALSRRSRRARDDDCGRAGRRAMSGSARNNPLIVRHQPVNDRRSPQRAALNQFVILASIALSTRPSDVLSLRRAWITSPLFSADAW